MKTAAALLILLGAPAIAGVPSAVTGALTACAGPDMTLAARVQVLAANGWRTAADMTETRALLALQGALRFPEAQSEVTNKWTVNLMRDLAAPLELDRPSGQPLGADDPVSLAPILLSAPDTAAILQVRIHVLENQNRYVCNCNLTLSAPLDDTDRDALLAALDLTDPVVPLGAYPVGMDLVFYTSDPGIPLRKARRWMDVTRLAPDFPLNTMAKAAGSPVSIATHIETTAVFTASEVTP
jgi:hypothetical protein